MILCVLCSLYRPSSTPRQPNNPQACTGCRDRLATELHSIPQGLAAVGGNLEPGRSGGERRSHGFESQPPLNVHNLSLVAPGSLIPSVDGRPWPQDQLGDVPPLDQLAWWVEDWIGVRSRHEAMPIISAMSLVAWLSNRSEWACDEHPAVDEFAFDVHRISGQLRVDTDRGEKVGRCPRKVGEAVCGTQLHVDPYVDTIRCTRCGQEWKRRDGQWLHLRAQQLAMGVDAA